MHKISIKFYKMLTNGLKKIVPKKKRKRKIDQYLFLI